MNNTNTAIRRLSAEGIALGQVRATIRRLQVKAAKESNWEDRRHKANNPQLNGTCWALEVEKACEKRLQEARNLQAHYPGIRADAASALGFRPTEWWDHIYNMATA